MFRTSSGAGLVSALPVRNALCAEGRGRRNSLAASSSDGGVKAAGRDPVFRPAAMFNDKTFYFLMVGAMWKSALSGGMTAKGSVTRLTALSWGQKSA